MPEMPGIRFHGPEAISNMLQMIKEKRPRPKIILDQKEKIETATRALEFRAANGGVVTEADIREIVMMKFELDALYSQWIEGRLDNKVEIVVV